MKIIFENQEFEEFTKSINDALSCLTKLKYNIEHDIDHITPSIDQNVDKVRCALYDLYVQTVYFDKIFVKK